MDYKTKALEKIKSKAYELALFNPDEKVARKAWNIFWLAVAGLEGRDKAAALATFSELSGVPTDDPERHISDAGGPGDSSSPHSEK